MRTSSTHEQKLAHLSANFNRFLTEEENVRQSAIARSFPSHQTANSKAVLDTLKTIQVQYSERFSTLRTLDDLAVVIASLNAQTQAGVFHPEGVKIVLAYIRQAL